ncbi:TPA: hypothetical protein MM834_003363 [Salmonella enterica subsp. houtenae]|nr:hypothetical protein [Salmonella enterica subsp. houtenae serovar 40:z4,z24:-]HBZ8550750.1 hypothetical protein [Salmonella enterica subsp. houtenae]
MNNFTFYTPEVVRKIMDDFKDAPYWFEDLRLEVDACHKKKNYALAETFAEAADSVWGLHGLLIELAAELTSLQFLLDCWPRVITEDSAIEERKKHITPEYLKDRLTALGDSFSLGNQIYALSADRESERLEDIAMSISGMYLHAQGFADEIIRLNFRLSYIPYDYDTTEDDIGTAEFSEYVEFHSALDRYIEEFKETPVVPVLTNENVKKLAINTASDMIKKLNQEQKKGKLDDGWYKPTKAMKHGFWRRQDILKELFRHLEKGDPIDCINYLAFMQANGWRTELPAQEHANE